MTSQCHSSLLLLLVVFYMLVGYILHVVGSDGCPLDCEQCSASVS